MQFRLVIASAAALAGFVAGRHSAWHDPAKPLVTVQREVETITVACSPQPLVAVEDRVLGEPEAEVDIDIDDDPSDAIEADETEAMRTVERESKRIAALESSLGPQGALRGQVHDTKTGESLAGATIVASIGNSTFTAISDEHGWYELQPLPTGTYTVTIYYLESTVEHRDVVLQARRVTALFAKVSSPTDNLGHGITFDETYTTEIPHARHFEELASSDPCAMPEEPDLPGVELASEE